LDSTITKIIFSQFRFLSSADLEDDLYACVTDLFEVDKQLDEVTKIHVPCSLPLRATTLLVTKDSPTRKAIVNKQVNNVWPPVRKPPGWNKPTSSPSKKRSPSGSSGWVALFTATIAGAGPH
jgi:hypothetical protein